MLDHSVAGCLETHKDDLKEITQPAVDAIKRVAKDGWESDYKAGGISSWGTDREAAHA
ncbi:hypothetical protein PN441_01490 [Spirulina major CS-329]|uniref:hypothetical protein n=1 Tax=Spirulina TaxID=1154 RepID=UPI00232EA437|nr:hypothetical protein [Spirulina subsalsa]MDB9495260.1 hypothetical protein [Spirulina subsalsa CS-330]MDB9501728.1 hypothetical protein [Spirulina major CS-329]